MKFAKIISLILAAVLSLACLAAAVNAAEPENLALSADPIYGTYSHLDGDWNWNIANINDGDVFEIGHDPSNNGGAAGGYHSGYGASMPEPQWVGFNFGAKKNFNTLVVYPINTNTMPVDFEIQVSDDGENWTSVLTETGYSIDVSHTSDGAHGNLPQTFTFEKQNKQFVRLYATTLNHDGANYAMKLTEIEVFNITGSASEGPENLAKWKPISSDSSHWDDNTKTWKLENLNDGDTVNLCTHFLDYGQFVGYHTSPATPRDGGADAHAQVTIELGEGTEFNTVVIYPSNELHSIKRLENRSDDPSNPDGIYFPENFIIQCSNDGENWTDIVTKTDYTATTDPQVFEFDDVTAKYIRLQMNNLTHFIKLTEMEVYDLHEDSVDSDVFAITSGKNAKATQGSKVTVKANADITSVTSSDVEITENDYTISGKTLVFKASFTKKLDPGAYTFIVNGENGEAEITITISAQPATGDFAIIAVSALAVISLAGAGLVITKRRKIEG